MIKGLIDFISTICPITGNDLIDTVLFALICAASLFVAFKLTGLFADETGQHDSSIMSCMHWIIRIVVFVNLLLLVIGIVNLIHFVTSWPWWGYLIFGLVVAHVITGVILIVFSKEKKKHNKETNK